MLSPSLPDEMTRMQCKSCLDSIARLPLECIARLPHCKSAASQHSPVAFHVCHVHCKSVTLDCKS